MKSPIVEVRPPRALAPIVEVLWRHAGAEGGARRVLPDGCADVLVDRGAGRAFVVGPMTRPFVVPAGHADFVGVRFQPGAAHALLGVPLDELLDAHADLGDVWADASEVLGRVLEAPTPAAAVEALAGQLERRLGRATPPDPRVAGAVEAVALAREGTSVEGLAAEAGLTRQHLARLFRCHVGLAPRTFARVMRLRRALSLLERGAPLARLALDAGYYDQAHLANEVRALTGLTPRELAASGNDPRDVPNLQDPLAAGR